MVRIFWEKKNKDMAEEQKQSKERTGTKKIWIMNPVYFLIGDTHYNPPCIIVSAQYMQIVCCD